MKNPSPLTMHRHYRMRRHLKHLLSPGPSLVLSLALGKMGVESNY
jgi:hypothetical protein